MTIVLCGGGSGGHITPLLAVAAELRASQPDARLVYLGEKGGKFAHIASGSQLFDELHYVSAGKLRRYHGESLITKLFDLKTNILNIRDVFRLLRGTVQGYFLLKRLKPSSILLKGGFVCVPVALAARAHHVPYITHDSDALPGLSNRFAARWARYQTVALPARYYPYPPASTRVVGVPTDDRFHSYSPAEQGILRDKYHVPKNAAVLLVTGGSNGARRLNQAMIEVTPELLENNPKLHILHQIGAGNDDQIASVAKNTTVASRVYFFDFTAELFHMSAIADVVVTRAGASIVADLAAQRKACVIVPNPYLTGGHQLKNAQVYAEAEAAVIVDEPDMIKDPQVLRRAIDDLLSDADQRARLSANLSTLNPKTAAARSLADMLTEIATT